MYQIQASTLVGGNSPLFGRSVKKKSGQQHNNNDNGAWDRKKFENKFYRRNYPVSLLSTMRFRGFEFMSQMTKISWKFPPPAYTSYPP